MKFNLYRVLFGAVLLAVSALSHFAYAANLVTNGSMTGTPSIGSPPPGWNSVSTDGDTIPVGGFSGWGTGIGASPDGGTFLAILNNGGGGSFDAAAQLVSGFVNGATYTLSFHFANIGLSQISDYANPGLIRANIAGMDFDTTVLGHDGFGSQRWFDFSTTFQATATSMQLTLSAIRPNNAFGGFAGGVDGVSITAVAVPEPETYAMLLAGLGLLGFISRRRKQTAV